MLFLLDTNTLIALFNQRSPALIAHLKSHLPSDIVVSSIVMHELYYGAYTSQRANLNLQHVQTLAFETIDFDKEDAICAGEIRAQLMQVGTPIGGLETLVAGQARARGLTLVTNNSKQFSQIAGLNCTDWLS